VPNAVLGVTAGIPERMKRHFDVDQMVSRYMTACGAP
jgi:hypothetical protein